MFERAGVDGRHFQTGLKKRRLSCSWRGLSVEHPAQAQDVALETRGRPSKFAHVSAAVVASRGMATSGDGLNQYVPLREKLPAAVI